MQGRFKELAAKAQQAGNRIAEAAKEQVAKAQQQQQQRISQRSLSGGAAYRLRV